MLPTGYSFNLDGTTLYLSLASVFVAQLAGVRLTFGQQLVMMLTLMLTSKGVAGVPRGALVVLTATLTQFGLPLEGAAILLGIDQMHGHGPHRGERHGQLHRHRGRRALGRRVRRRADAGVRGVRLVQGRLMRIAVVGARGQLGAAVVHECAPAHEVVAFSARRPRRHRRCGGGGGDAAGASRRDRQRRGVQRRRRRGRSSGRRAATSTPSRCASLARAAQSLGATLVHYSTDFVFDGTRDDAVHGDGPPEPAERLRRVEAARRVVRARGAAAPTCLRVESLFGRAPGAGPEKGSVANIVRTLVAGGSPKVFQDRTMSPTCIPDAARATRHLLETKAAPGLYHCVNSGRCTWLELAQEIARQLGEPQLEARLVPVRVSEVTLKARRPQFCALANDKLRAAGVDMPPWQEALAHYVRERRSGDHFAASGI